MKIKGNKILLGELFIIVFDPNGNLVKDYGKVSEKYITNAYVAYYTDALQGLVTGIGDFKYHDSGTGITAEDVADTALETPVGIARIAGTQVEGGSNIYKTVAVITYDGNYDITEWALFNGATGNTMMDRAVFTAVPVVNDYTVEYTYLHTALAGG